VIRDGYASTIPRSGVGQLVAIGSSPRGIARAAAAGRAAVAAIAGTAIPIALTATAANAAIDRFITVTHHTPVMPGGPPRRQLSGEADVEREVPEPQVQHAAASPVHKARQEDDDDNRDHQPEKEHDNPRYGVPGNCSRSNHAPRLPVIARFIPYEVKINISYPERTLRSAYQAMTASPQSGRHLGFTAIASGRGRWRSRQDRQPGRL
jgi:hypothetical protein